LQILDSSLQQPSEVAKILDKEGLPSTECHTSLSAAHCSIHSQTLGQSRANTSQLYRSRDAAFDGKTEGTSCDVSFSLHKESAPVKRHIFASSEEKPPTGASNEFLRPPTFPLDYSEAEKKRQGSTSLDLHLEFQRRRQGASAQALTTAQHMHGKCSSDSWQNSAWWGKVRRLRVVEPGQASATR
jgi:hypothetical protein